jgi:hypothetical protein
MPGLKYFNLDNRMYSELEQMTGIEDTSLHFGVKCTEHISTSIFESPIKIYRMDGVSLFFFYYPPSSQHQNSWICFFFVKQKIVYILITVFVEYYFLIEKIGKWIKFGKILLCILAQNYYYFSVWFVAKIKIVKRKLCILRMKILSPKTIMVNFHRADGSTSSYPSTKYKDLSMNGFYC